MNQHQRIIKYLKDYQTINPFQAFADLGITKLATRISEIMNTFFVPIFFSSFGLKYVASAPESV